MPANSSGTTAFVQQTKQPAERADKALRLIGPPVHGLGPGERAYFLRQRSSLRTLSALWPGPLHGGGGVFAFGRGDLFQRADWDAGFFGEGLGRRSWLPVREGRFPGGAGKLFLQVELLGEHALDAHCQAARGGVAGNDRGRLQQTLRG